MNLIVVVPQGYLIGPELGTDHGLGDVDRHNVKGTCGDVDRHSVKGDGGEVDRHVSVVGTWRCGQALALRGCCGQARIRDEAW